VPSGDLLQTGFAARYAKAVAAKPSAKQIKIGRFYLSGTDPQIDKAIDDALTKAGFQGVALDQTFKSEWDQAETDGNTTAAAGAWISKRRYLSKWGVRARTKAVILLGRLLYPGRYRRALERRPEWKHALHHVFQTVDFIALPTVQARPPTIPWFWFGKRAVLEARFERAKHGRGEFCWKSGTRRASSAKTRVVSRYESAVGRPKV
jgi:amidase